MLILANVGLPMLGVAFLGWFWLVPVAFIETVLAVVFLRWSLGFAAKWVSLANLLTTVIGIPVTWGLVLMLSIFTSCIASVFSPLFEVLGWGDAPVLGVVMSPAWLTPNYMKDLNWAIPLAMIVLCVPFYFMSFWFEYVFLYVKATRRDQAKQQALLDFCWKSNLVTYALIVLVIILSF